MEETHVPGGTLRSPDSWQWSRWQAPGLAYGAIGATDRRRGAPVDQGCLSQYQHFFRTAPDYGKTVALELGLPLSITVQTGGSAKFLSVAPCLLSWI